RPQTRQPRRQRRRHADPPGARRLPCVVRHHARGHVRAARHGRGGEVNSSFTAMPRLASVPGWLRARARDHATQLRLCLRVTVSVLASFILAQFLAVPLAGLWAVLTAVVVTQTSIGGSLKATVEYFVGTLGGAVYASLITILIP